MNLEDPALYLLAKRLSSTRLASLAQTSKSSHNTAFSATTLVSLIFQLHSFLCHESLRCTDCDVCPVLQQGFPPQHEERLAACFQQCQVRLKRHAAVHHQAGSILAFFRGASYLHCDLYWGWGNTSFFVVCSLEISSKEMNIGANRMAAILTNKAKEQGELNIWRQFGGLLAFYGCFMNSLGLPPVTPH